MKNTSLISHAFLYESTIQDSPRFLSRLIEKSKVEDQLKPVTVIVPSRYCGLMLQRELGRIGSGLINVRFIQISELAQLILKSDLMIQEIFPLKRSVERAVLRKLLLSTNDPFRLFKEHPSLLDFFSRLFGKINLLSSKGFFKHRFGESQKVREIVDIYNEFHRIVGLKYFSSEYLYEKVCTKIVESSDLRINSVGKLIFYLPSNLSVAQVKMVDALPVKFETEILVGLTGDVNADTRQKEFIKGISGNFQLVKQRINVDHTNSQKKVFVASDPRLEAKWVISDILMKSENNPFRSVAIFYPKADPYQKIFHQEMRISGIPFVGPSSKKFGDFAVGNALKSMLQIISSDYDRKFVMAWLSNCPVSFPKLSRGIEYEHSLLNRISKEAGILRGFNNWENRLTQFIERESLKYATDDFTHGRQIEAAKFLRSSMAKFYHKSIIFKNGDNTWSGFAELTVDLLKEYLVSEKELPDDELNALTTIFTKINELAELDALENVSKDVSFLEFVNAIDDILSESISRVGLTGHGVFISDQKLGLGMQFDYVYFVGMTQSDFPVNDLQAEALIDEIMNDAFGNDFSSEEFNSEDNLYQLYVFKSLVNSAKRECSFSFPLYGVDSQQTDYPSDWLLEYVSGLAGEKIYASKFISLLDDTSDVEWLTYISSFEQILAMQERHGVIDLSDYDLTLTMELLQKDIPINEHKLLAGSHILSAAEMISTRRSNIFSEWDGDVSNSPDLVGVIEKIFSNPISATSLEEWAECPYRFFLHYILGIRQKIDDPSEIFQISPQDSGSLIHQILEDFFEQVITKGEFPASNESWSKKHYEILYSIADENFSKAENHLITSDNALWRHKKNQILTDLKRFLIEDDQIRFDFGTRHTLIEQRFGKQNHSDPDGLDYWPYLEMDFPGQKIIIRGTIDRVDFNDKNEGLIIDYKTGRSDAFANAFKKDDFGEGTKLQLPLYSIAASQAKSDSEQKKNSFFAAYWFISESEDFKRLPQYWRDLNRIDQTDIIKTSNVVQKIVRGVKSGIFPANPVTHDGKTFQEIHGFNQGNCRNCDFIELCPMDRSKIYKNRQAQDDRLKDYLSLKNLTEVDVDE